MAARRDISETREGCMVIYPWKNRVANSLREAKIPPKEPVST
jgi:hypothetical protein